MSISFEERLQRERFVSVFWPGTPKKELVELSGIEPLASSLRTRLLSAAIWKREDPVRVDQETSELRNPMAFLPNLRWKLGMC